MMCQVLQDFESYNLPSRKVSVTNLLSLPIISLTHDLQQIT